MARKDKTDNTGYGVHYTVSHEIPRGLKELRAREVELTAPKPSAINPGHYRGFSYGSEVIDITENLSFNGGNAVKYIARATRSDGQNKGAVIEDLRKARWYIQRELERLEAEGAGED